MKNCKYADIDEVECRCPEAEINNEHCFLCITASTLTELANMFSYFGNAKIPIADAVGAYQSFRHITVNLDCFARFRNKLIEDSPALQKIEKQRLAIAKRFGMKNNTYRI